MNNESTQIKCQKSIRLPNGKIRKCSPTLPCRECDARAFDQRQQQEKSARR